MEPFNLRVDNKLSLHVCDLSAAEAIYRRIDANREEFAQWFTWVNRTHRVSDVRHYLEKCIIGYAQGTSLECVIRYNNKWVGCVGLMDICVENRTAEVGYWLIPEARGQHVMSRSVQALVRYGFDRRGLHRIELCCAPDNDASRHVALATGFTHEGTRKQASWIRGYAEDVEVYRLLRSEFDQLQRQ